MYGFSAMSSNGCKISTTVHGKKNRHGREIISIEEMSMYSQERKENMCVLRERREYVSTREGEYASLTYIRIEGRSFIARLWFVIGRLCSRREHRYAPKK